MSNHAPKSLLPARAKPRAVKLWHRLKSIIPRSPKPLGHTLGGTGVPSEIYLHIFSTLSRSDLLSLLQLSRSTRCVLTPTVIATLDLSVDITAYTPLSVRGVHLPLPVPLLQPTGHAPKRGLARIGGLVTRSTFILSAPTFNPFTFTTHLTLSHHDRTMCDRVSPLVMPNLISLRIQPGPLDHQLGLCSSSITNSCCPLITHLRPRQLIIGGYTTGLNYPTTGLWSTDPSSFPPPFVQHLVILLGTLSGPAPWENFIAPLSFKLHGNLKKVTYVIASTEKGREPLKPVRESPFDNAYHLWLASQGLATQVMQAPDGHLQLVETEGSDEAESLMVERDPARDMKTGVSLKMKEYVLKEAWPVDTAEERARVIEFVEHSFRQQGRRCCEILAPLDMEESEEVTERRRVAVKKAAVSRRQPWTGRGRCVFEGRKHGSRCFFLDSRDDWGR